MKNLLRAIIAGTVLFFIFFVIAYNVIEISNTSMISVGGNIIKMANKTIASASISLFAILIIVLITGVFVYIECLKKQKEVKKCTKKFVIFVIITIMLALISLFFFFVNITNKFV